MITKVITWVYSKLKTAYNNEDPFGNDSIIVL